MIRALALSLIATTAFAQEFKPAPQIADHVKAMAGTWKCTGTSIGMDGKDVPYTGSYSTKSDLDGFWTHESFVGTAGTGKTSFTYKFESYATYDEASKKWRHILIDSYGGQAIGTSDAEKDGKSETLYEVLEGPGKAQMKHVVDASDLKKGVHMSGTMSKDSGKTWMKIFDLTCTAKR
ncbi:MAG TPA: hypothetical protein VGC41_28140 [Kofleriaceae bacterium]